MLDDDKAILMIRGEKPIIDKKYNILKHPNVKYTTDGQAKPYRHGNTDRANTSIYQLKEDEIDIHEIKNIKEDIQTIKITTELLSEEEIEDYFLKEEYEYENERKRENSK